MAPIFSFTATLCGVGTVCHGVTSLHPQLIAGIIATLGVVLGSGWKIIVVTILAFAIATTGVMSEIYTARVTPVFPLTPPTTT